jgi:integrase
MDLDLNDILTILVLNGKIGDATIEQEDKMYIEQHNSKIWQGTNGLWYTYLPGRKLVKRHTEKDIYRAIAKYYRELEENPTVKDIFNEWLDGKLDRQEITQSTYARYKQDYVRYLEGTNFEKRKIRSIFEYDLDEFVRQTLSGKRLKRKAYANFRTLILGIFKYGKRKGLVQFSITNFFKDLDLSRSIFESSIKHPENEVFNEDEIPKLMQWLSEHPSIPNLGIMLDFQTGLRTAELAALKFSDVEKDILHVQRQEIHYKLDGRNIYEVVDYTKTEMGDRYVYLPKSAVHTINRIRELNPYSDYMMYENGKKLLKYTFNDHLRTACRELDISKRTMHKIRKTYGTILIDSGVDDSLIMNQMGHKDISTTRSYYYFANKNDTHKRQQIESAITF